MSKMGCEFDCRHIPTARQGVACADWAEEFAIEIFGIVFTETSRCVCQDRQRVNQSLLERERVNEWFQRRTGRAWTARSVHLTVDVGFVKIRRSNVREHVHGAGIDQKRRCVVDTAIPAVRDVIGYSALDCSLLLEIECGDDLIASA